MTPEQAQTLSQTLQDHMEQHHGVALRASEWDAVVGCLSPIIDGLIEEARHEARREEWKAWVPLLEAVEKLPVKEWTDQDESGEAYLVGYVMQAQGEWDEVQKAVRSIRARQEQDQ